MLVTTGEGRGVDQWVNWQLGFYTLSLHHTIPTQRSPKPSPKSQMKTYSVGSQSALSGWGPDGPIPSGCIRSSLGCGRRLSSESAPSGYCIVHLGVLQLSRGRWNYDLKGGLTGRNNVPGLNTNGVLLLNSHFVHNAPSTFKHKGFHTCMRHSMVAVMSLTPRTKILSSPQQIAQHLFIWQTFTLDGCNPQRHLSLPLGI